MNKMYVLYCEHWTWTRSTYDIEFIAVFEEGETATEAALSMQKLRGRASRYIVQEVELRGK